ncbi:MAG: DNA alkylation repair protein [bacterium]|nr:DNA alkylation repair protein [bacterium]
MTNEIISLLNEHADEKQAEKMSAYMQNRFAFAGVPKPMLKELIKPYLTKTAKEPIDWEFVFDLWDHDFREAQYIALEYLNKHHKQLMPEDMDHLKRLITTKSWWETVDTIDAYVGKIVKKDERLKEVILQWAVDENIWLRRVAIDFQQEYKLDTDTELLKKIIVLNLGSEEFFINKAIGWSLRDYSKVNPDWVRDFVDEYRDRMAPLSIKEATKLL